MKNKTRFKRSGGFMKWHKQEMFRHLIGGRARAKSFKMPKTIVISKLRVSFDLHP